MQEGPWDVAVIGSGPVGLFASSMCALLGLRTVVLETLHEIGGQCSALYPHKKVCGVPGFPNVTARELVKGLGEQVSCLGVALRLGWRVRRMEYSDATWRMESDSGSITAKAVIIAVGMGSLTPNKPDLEGIERFEGRYVHYHVKEPTFFAGQSVVIAGGGDSAVDWALELACHAKDVTLVHRRDVFRCAPSNLEKLGQKESKGEVRILRSHRLLRLEGEEKLERAVVEGEDGQKILEVDHFLVFFGLLPHLTDVQQWPVTIERQRIRIDRMTCGTGQPGLFAVGDAVTYEGKVNIIASGFGEAVTAAYGAAAYLRPDTPLRKDSQSFHSV